MPVIPYLYYEDVGRAMKFLSAAFGFKKYGRSMKGANGKVNHAVMKVGKDVIMMGCPPKGYKNPKKLGQATQSLYINVADADRHFQRARKAGAMVLEEPQDTPYGQRRYGVEDPEGHQWYFAHELKKPHRKQTAGRTHK
jgi:uncharacterized glyoxalase superfamily protein PhnB